ncbi:plasmid partitioning protein RepA [Ruegeria sediminis]|uniref:Plasmid partitioning protein RepA n=1 Tax=Ruegeria sediminis TaxID=2583820 RepID=A0ABY2WS35_9RHOB|nr:plasmid partitioning protein RepA [Ruegeria sediminis]TMV02595.1 plasmid partitioning protein RepA [Ruegeria sediminis]
MLQTTPIDAATQSQFTRQISDRLQLALTAHLEHAYSPDHVKSLRLFSATETAELIGVTPAFLRKGHADGSLAEPAVNKSGRRFYSGDEIWEMRQILEAGSRKPGKYRPGRRDDDHLQVIQFMNFKGGSAKSTSAIHLCHYLALQGYRVLAIDLDPQSSLTGFCGLNPELEFDGQSVYDAMRYEDALPMQECIQKTYFPGLDLAPARLILSEFEVDTAVYSQEGVPFYTRLSNAIEQVEVDYDVVVIDSPPSLGYLTMAGLFSATSIIVPLTPSMLDVASTQQFLQMMADYIEAFEKQGIEIEFEDFSFLITRDDPSDVPSQQITGLMRALFQKQVLSATTLRSTAVADAAMLKCSIFEINRSDITRTTYDRARASMDAFGAEVAGMIQKNWGR